MESLVHYEIKDRVGYLTLNRPEKRNALSAEMVTALKEKFKQAELDQEAKVIVIAANGEAFCAGADLAYLKSLQSNSYEENLADSKHLMELFSMIYYSSKVSIARIQGSALAGGCGLANVCDFSFAATEAKFGYTEVKIGFIPAIVMVFLVRKIGEAKTRELLLSGKIINAEKALSLGLINQIIPKESLNDEVHELALRLCVDASAESLKRTRQMIAKVQDMSFDEGLEYAAAQNAEARASADCQRGISAFLNKEKISW